jgi:6,7-dimethyl-8-ribityllumazine synthase
LHLIALTRKWGAQTKGVGFKAPSDAIQLAGTDLAITDNGPTTA